MITHVTSRYLFYVIYLSSLFIIDGFYDNGESTEQSLST